MAAQQTISAPRGSSFVLRGGFIVTVDDRLGEFAGDVLVVEGKIQEVARRIGLSVETVKSDTKRVIGKLQADTRTHAVAIALRQALIE